MEFACEQIANAGAISRRKMFGGYMIYVNLKPIVLVCNNTAYVKKLPEVARVAPDLEIGAPYKGAKDHYILNLDNADESREIAIALEKITEIPKRKTKKN